MPQKPSQRSRPRYRLGSFLLSLCFACLLITEARAASPCAPPAFNTAPVIRFTGLSSPGSIITADFNRDGRGDLAVTSQTNWGRIVIPLGAGDGTFGGPSRLVGGGTGPTALKAADLNGDAVSPNVQGTVPVIRLREFLADTQQLGQGAGQGR